MSAARRGTKRAPFTISAGGRAKLSAARIGKKHSPETRAKIGASQLGKKGRVPSAETRAKLSAAHRGKKWGHHTEVAIAKMRAARLGKPLTAEHRAKISAALRGDKSSLWRGGKAREVRDGTLYRPWRLAVLRRDNSTCQWCGKANLRGSDKQVDHIMAWGDAPDMRFEVWNGRTLCGWCHSVRTARQTMERHRSRRAA